MPQAFEFPHLSEVQAQAGLQQHGPNRLADPQRRTVLHNLADVVREPMFVMLLAGAAVYLLVGDLGEGLLLGGFALVTVGLVVWQGWRRERALQALRDLSCPQVQVLRDGRWQRREASGLVPGDCILLEEGERVAADARLLQASQLRVDESLLTGESWPVEKAPVAQISGDAAATRADDLVWAGTLVVAGQAVAQVQHTGSRTRMGAIGVSLSSIEQQDTPAQRRIQTLVRAFGALALLVCVAVLLVQGLWAGRWWDGALSALALGMGMLPEEFPMALAIFMSLGAWRLSRLQVLARRPAAVEALGSLTVLCVDKTGTLTENHLRLAALQTDAVAQRMPAPGSGISAGMTPDLPTGLPPCLCRLLWRGVSACRPVGVDPADVALREAQAAVRDTTRTQLRTDAQSGVCNELGGSGVADPAPLRPKSFAAASRVHEVAPSPEAPLMRVAWRGASGHLVWVCKGAPEHVLSLCVGDPNAARQRQQAAAELAERGWRVLAVADHHGASHLQAPVSSDAQAKDQSAPSPSGGDTWPTPPQRGWRWLGLLAFEDPLRPHAASAVASVQGAGVRVVMVSGDHPRTARAIAQQAGLHLQHGVLTGEAYAALSSMEQQRAAQQVHVFARVQPQHKLALVQTLQAMGEVVAMTGDGVNDAPALRAAHIGVAMGGRGTDVAREAASMVLMDGDFAHLAKAVALGRRLLDNLRRVSVFITAVHVPLAGLALLPLGLGWPVLMLPAHVVLTEMVIDPMCSLAFENAAPARDLMTRPPRRSNEPLLLPWPELARGLALGLALLLAMLGLATLAREAGHPTEAVRTIVIVGLSAGNWSLALVSLQRGVAWRDLWRGSSRVLGAIGLSIAAVLTLALGWAPLRGLLGLTFPGAAELAAAVLCGVGAVVLANTLWWAAEKLKTVADSTRKRP